MKALYVLVIFALASASQSRVLHSDITNLNDDQLSRVVRGNVDVIVDDRHHGVLESDREESSDSKIEPLVPDLSHLRATRSIKNNAHEINGVLKPLGKSKQKRSPSYIYEHSQNFYDSNESTDDDRAENEALEKEKDDIKSVEHFRPEANANHQTSNSVNLPEAESAERAQGSEYSTINPLLVPTNSRTFQKESEPIGLSENANSEEVTAWLRHLIAFNDDEKSNESTGQELSKPSPIESESETQFNEKIPNDEFDDSDDGTTTVAPKGQESKESEPESDEESRILATTTEDTNLDDEFDAWFRSLLISASNHESEESVSDESQTQSVGASKSKPNEEENSSSEEVNAWIHALLGGEGRNNNESKDSDSVESQLVVDVSEPEASTEVSKENVLAQIGLLGMLTASGLLSSEETNFASRPSKGFDQSSDKMKRFYGNTYNSLRTGYGNNPRGLFHEQQPSPFEVDPYAIYLQRQLLINPYSMQPNAVTSFDEGSNAMYVTTRQPAIYESVTNRRPELHESVLRRSQPEAFDPLAHWPAVYVRQPYIYEPSTFESVVRPPAFYAAARQPEIDAPMHQPNSYETEIHRPVFYGSARQPGIYESPLRQPIVLGSFERPKSHLGAYSSLYDENAHQELRQPYQPVPDWRYPMAYNPYRLTTHRFGHHLGF